MINFGKYIEFLLGIFVMSFGAVLALKTNIGVAPWDAVNFGLSNSFGMTTGTWITISSFIIVAFLEKNSLK